MSEKLQWLLLVAGWTVPAGYSFILHKRLKLLEQDYKVLSINFSAAYSLISVETKRREEHAKALKRLTDPESIADDMERGARMREMRDANRTVLPREDAGPPAKVYTPTMRARVPKGNYKRESSKD
jgi:hypothetical protein